MDFPKETSRRGLLSRLCHVFADKNVQQGIGAVLVLVGFTLLISGVIFTIVAYTGTKRNVIGSFPYVGPVMIAVGVLCILNGYILSHKDDFVLLWFYFKRRKQRAYAEQEYWDSEELSGSISAICFRVLVCMFTKRNSRDMNEQVDQCDSTEVSSANEIVRKAELRSIPDITSSFSPFRQSKVHPGNCITESSV